MIRQAQTYLVSAMSAATLIAIAIVAFVLLVSIQVFRDWPIAALGGSNEAHISDSRATSTPPATTATTASRAGGATKGPAPGSANGARSNGGSAAAPTQVSEGSLAPSSGPTATTSPVDDGGSGNGADQGSDTPSSSSPTQSPSHSGQGSSSSAGGSGSNAGSGGSETASTPTGQLTDTVNNTVNQVDEKALGGTLEKTGVTQVAEGVVNGVAGPESAVGKVVDGTVETVTGLLGGKR